MRRLVSIALVALAALSSTGAAGLAHAEVAPSNANTPKLALHKAEIWLALAEPKPSVADLDAGMSIASAVEARLSMLNTEIGAIISRRRTILVQAGALKQKAAELRAERDAPRGENEIRKDGALADARIADLEQRIAALDGQADSLYSIVQRISVEERALVDAIGRVRTVTDMIEASTVADAKQKQKAGALATKTNKSIKIHAAIIMTVMNASTGQPTSS